MSEKSHMGPTSGLDGPSGYDALEAAELQPMISYAQNFEDVILRRALGDIHHGFYVDLGAFHPEIDSVTRWFYGQGWTGVNVEPNPHFFDMLQKQRPHDVNLPFAVAGEPGTVQLLLMDGLSSIVKENGPRLAEEHPEAGRAADVEAVTLDHILSSHTGDRTVDFLKIDVEGAEAQVLNACAFDSCRPRILVVEATEPNSTRSTADAWEPQLLSKGYTFAYFDGLNRFYVRNEDAWRSEHMRAPPNVFDRFLLPLSDARNNLAEDWRAADTGLPVGGVPGLLAQRDEMAVQLEACRRRDEERMAQIAEHDAQAAHLAAQVDMARQSAKQAENQLGRAEAQLAQAATDLASLRAERDRLLLDLAQINLTIRKTLNERDNFKLCAERDQAVVAALKASRSWRITAPIRRFSVMLKRRKP